MYRISIEPSGQTLEAQPGERLIDVFRRYQVELDTPCGGKCLCGKCRVIIQGSEAGERERNFFSEAECREGYRLACAVHVEQDMTVKIHMRGKSRIAVEGRQRKTEKTGQSGWGIAVDLGTTTIAMYLVDLAEGRTVRTLSAVNEQKSCGADVISRITYCMENGTEILHDIIIEQIIKMTRQIAGGHTIKKMVVAGNTVMEHIFMGKDPAGLATAPFTPVFLDGQRTEISGIDTLVMPCVSPYIGGDITASILACEMDTAEETELLADIGTNGEMVLAFGGTYYCCSAAAGPAFEGSHISCGTGSVEGAVCSVRLKNGMIYADTIGKKPSCGICGSGLIDLAAELVREEIVDSTGKIRPKIQQKPEWRRYITPDEQQFIVTPTVKITQRDIRELQMAKSAVCSGIMALMNQTGISAEDISRIHLGGGMGSSMNADHAFAIGLLPKVLTGKAYAAGNTAGSGAVSVLLEPGLWEKARNIRKQSKVIELADVPEFQQLYLAHMAF